MNEELIQYMSTEEVEIVRRAEEIVDKAACRHLTELLGVPVEYVDVDHISVDGEVMDRQQFGQYLRRTACPSEEGNLA